MIRQAFGNESMSVPESPNAPTPKNARQVEKKVKSMLNIFFALSRIVHKEFVLAGKSSNSAYCCHVLQRLRENPQKLRPEF
jgi:hypothetical protein